MSEKISLHTESMYFILFRVYKVRRLVNSFVLKYSPTMQWGHEILPIDYHPRDLSGDNTSPWPANTRYREYTMVVH